MKLKLFTIIGFAILVGSCDCSILVKGQILSSVNGTPISGAKIEMLGKDITQSSDKNGYFKIGEMTGFCYTPTIRVTYDGYKPFEMEVEADSDFQNYKLRSHSEIVEFDQPVYPDSTNRNTSISSTWIESYSENFEVKSDSLIIYLDEINLKKEIELIEEQLNSKNNG